MSAQTHITTDVKVNDAGASANLSKIGIASKRAGQQMDMYTTALEKSSKQAKKANDSFRMMRGGMGQIGHQLQDITVMLQSGQSPFIIMAQQGSQIASLFGSRGALVGAVLAVGAAIGGVMAYNTIQAQKEIKKLGDEILDLAKNTEVLTDAMRMSAMTKLTDDIIELHRETREFQKTIDNTGRFDLADLLDMDTYALSFGVLTNNATMTAEALRRIESTSIHAAGGIDRNNLTLEKFNKQLGLFQDGVNNPLFDKLGNDADKSAQKFTDLTSKLSEMRYELSMTEEQLLRVEAVQASGGDMVKLVALNAQIDAYIKTRDAIKAKNDQTKNEQKAEEDALKAKQKFLASIQSQNEKLTLTEQARIALKASTMNLNYAEEQAVITVINELNARDQLKAKLDAEAQARKNLKDTISSTLSDLGKFDSMSLSLGSPMDRAQAEFEQKMSWLESLKSTEMNNLRDIQGLQDRLREENAAKVIDSQLALISGFETMQQAGEQALSSIILQGGTLEDAFTAVANTITTSVISSIVQMGVEYVKQQLVGQAIEKAGQAATVASGVATGSALATAYAPAAALASLASFGANAVPAQAGIASTVGMSQALAMASFEGGGITFNGVRSGGVDGKGGRMAVVHPNEKITDLEKGGSMGQPVNVSFNINAVDAKGIDQLLYERRGAITAMVQKAVNNSGRRI